MKHKALPYCHPNRVYKARGLCNACYLRARRHGTAATFSKIDYTKALPIKAQCHPTEVHVARGLCNSCYKKAKYLAHPKQRKIPACHPDRRSGGNGLCRSCYLKQYQLQTKYGISWEQYQELLVKQNFLCAICKQPETQKRNGKLVDLCIDHDHITHKIRGLLCLRCNVILGHIEDTTVLQRSLDYLAKYKRDGI